MKKWDVLVIGAGAAGLAAAGKLIRAGKKVALLFIHGRPDPILRRLPLLRHALIYSVMDHHHRLKKRGLEEFNDAWKEILQPMKGLKRLKKDRSFEEHLKNPSSSSRQKRLAKMFIEGFDAAESAKVSAKSLSSFAEEMRGAVCVRATAQDRILNLKAEKVLLTLPLGVWKAKPSAKGAVVFDPPLPEKEKALEKMEMGSVVKVVLLFDFSFWEKVMKKEEIAFIHCAPKDPFQVLWSFLPIQIPMWTAWAGGSAALRLSSFSEEELVEEAFKILSRAFGVTKNFLKEHLVRSFFHPWARDPFSRGAYSYVGVEGLSSQKVLMRPEQDTLFFAGEALHESGQTGTVDAALSSGERAAEWILKTRRIY